VPAKPPVPDAIDGLLALDLGGRGIASVFRPGAALGAARALRDASRVLLVTGFAVGQDLPESDGPPGTAVLGRALRRLGAAVRYVTDPTTAPVLAATLKELEEPAEILPAPGDDGAAAALLAEERPSHLVAVERPGRTASGDYLNARGVSVAAWNRPLDGLFLAARRGHGGRPVTVGVGDGGNEVGMGNVRARLARAGPMLARIASVVRVDHLVVAGVSNWGAYGIVAQLARLTGLDLLHTPAVERRLVEACAESGAVDGITRQREATVDGLPLDAHAALVQLLRVAAATAAPPTQAAALAPRRRPVALARRRRGR
jgi:hypothetical protein